MLRYWLFGTHDGKQRHKNMATASNARTYEQEQRYWVNQLRDDQLNFANLILNKGVNGFSNVEAYVQTHPDNHSSREVQAVTAYRMLHCYEVEGYMAAMRQEVVEGVIMSMAEMKEDLTVQIRGYEFLFEGYVTWEDTPSGRIAFVDRLDLVPERLRKYITGHQYYAESEGYQIFLKQYSGKESDKNKARELLAKMQGGLIDRKEVNINAVVAGQVIDDDTSAEDAAAIYARVMTRKD